MGNSEKVSIHLAQAESLTDDEVRKLQLNQRAARVNEFMQAFQVAGNANICVPIENLTYLRDDVGSNGVLQSCNRFKAAAVGRLGFTIEQSPYNRSSGDDKEKSEIEDWVRRVFKPSFQTVCYRVLTDKYDYGMGLFLVDTNDLEIKRNGKTVGREIVKITHLNRLVAFPVQPRKIKKSVQVGEIKGVSKSFKEIEIDDPADVVYPRWVIRSGDQLRWAKSFGDPRFINKYTGETAELSFGKETQKTLIDGPAVIAIREYDSRDEICGFPLWYAEKQSVDISWEIGRYEKGHFRSNCIPNIIAILPEAKLPGNKTLTDVFTGFLSDTATARSDGLDSRKALAIEIPMRALERDKGSLPILIQEIKGPDPSQFLELNKAKGQRISNACQVPPSLVHADTGALGSGADKEADLKRLLELVLEPEQASIESEALDEIVLTGTQFASWVIRLKRIDTSDPKKQAEIAEIWGRVPGQKLSEFRARIGATEAIDPESEERSKKLGQIWMFGTQGLMSLDDLEAVTEAAIEEEQQPIVPEEKDPPKPTDGKRFAEYLRTVLDVTPEQFKNQVLPVLQERICQKS